MINVNWCGHDSHHIKSWDMEHQNGLPNYLLLLIKRDGWLIREGKKVRMPQNTAVLFAPDSYIRYGCDFADFKDDWIHFIGDEADDAFIASLGIPLGQPVYPYDFHMLSQYVVLLTETFRAPAPHTGQMLDALMRGLLYALSDSLKKSLEENNQHKYYSALASLRTRLYNNPANKWNVETMAADQHLSLSHFQHLYKMFFSCSCRQDIIQARLGLAKFHLSTTEMSIRELSDFCGYENEVHFMRQFKKFVGVTPSEYRRLHTG